jgi:hypothetical protein
MKVAKKVRLLQKDKDGLFIKNENYAVLRSRAVVEGSVVQETVDNYEYTGVLYMVDKEATKEWEDAKNPKKVEVKPVTKTK